MIDKEVAVTHISWGREMFGTFALYTVPLFLFVLRQDYGEILFYFISFFNFILDSECLFNFLFNEIIYVQKEKTAA